MLIHFPETLRAEWFEKSADVGPIVRNGSKSHNGGPPGSVGKMLSINASSIVLWLSLLRRCHAVSIEITCKHVNLLTNHDGTDGEDELLSNTPFFGVDISRM